MTTADGLVGVLGAVVLGAVVAVGVAVGLSPLAPFGAVRPVYPDLGVAFDWTVLGLGFAVLVVVLSAAASVLMAYRVSPRTVATWSDGDAPSAAPSTVAGGRRVRPATRGRDRHPFGPRLRRRARRGAGALGHARPVLAVVVVVTSITFGASLSFLVSHPPLYGWNWNYALLSGFSGAEDLPAAQTAALLDHDPVAHWAGVYFEHVKLDGQDVPVLAGPPERSRRPDAADRAPRCSRRTRWSWDRRPWPRSTNMSATPSSPTPGGADRSVCASWERRRCPPSGVRAVRRSRWARGAVVASPCSRPGSQPAGELRAGPERRPDHDPAGGEPVAARRSLDRITADPQRPSDPDGPVGGVVSVLRPAEIANYRAVGSTPTLLASVLAAGRSGRSGSPSSPRSAAADGSSPS